MTCCVLGETTNLTKLCTKNLTLLNEIAQFVSAICRDEFHNLIKFC